MKRFFIIFMAFLLFTIDLFSLSKMEQNKIKNKIIRFLKNINTQNDSYSKKETELEGFSSEGGVINSYYDNNDNLIYIDVWIFGEMGKVNEKYYLADDNLIYIEVDEWDYPQAFDVENAKKTSNYYIINNNATYVINKEIVIYNLYDDNYYLDSLKNYIDQLKDYK